MPSFSSGDRNDLTTLHGMPPSLAGPRQHRDASRGLWKKPPTNITPGQSQDPTASGINIYNRALTKPRQSGGGIARGGPSSDTRLRANGGGTNSTVGNQTATATMVNSRGVPRKKQKLSDEAPHASNGRMGGYGRRSRTRGTPLLAPECVNHKDEEVINVDDDEDIGIVLGTPEPDDMNITASRPRAGTMPEFHNRMHPNHSAEVHHIAEDGAFTKRLQTKYPQVEVIDDTEDSDPIQDFEDPIPPKPPTQGRVKQSAANWPPSTRRTPHLDLAEVAKTLNVKQSMNPRQKTLLQLDSVSTKLSSYSRPPSKGGLKAGPTRLPLLAWCAGSKLLTEPGKSNVIWNRKNETIEIRDSPPGESASNKLSIRLHYDIATVKYSQLGDTSGEQSVIIALDTSPSHRNISLSPSLAEAFSMGGVDGKGSITLKFDTTHAEWDSKSYNEFVDKLATVIKKKEILRPIGSTSVWDMASRLCNPQKTAETHPRGPASPTPLPQRDRPLKRPASAEPLVTPSPPPPPASATGTKSSDTMTSEQLVSAPVRFRPRPAKRDIPTPSTPMPPEGLRRSSRQLTQQQKDLTPPPADSDEVILVYPKGVTGAVNITNADVRRLKPGEFLNDTLIEFGLKLWLKEVEDQNPGLAKQIHVFSSFFYKKLNKKSPEDGFESVRKWTSKINLFEKKYIIVPINENVHWYLAIIYHPEHILSPPVSPVTRRRSRLAGATESPTKPLRASILRSKPRSTVRSPTRANEKGEGSFKPLSANASSATVSTDIAQSTDDGVQLISDEVVEMVDASGGGEPVSLRGSQEAQTANTSDMEVEDLLSFEHSCSITLPDEPPANDLFTQNDTGDSRSSKSIPSVDEGMVVDSQSREPSPSVSDFAKVSTVDGDATTRSPSMVLSDEEKIFSTEEKQADVATTSFDDDQYTDGVSTLTPVPPVRFYGKASNKAEGKQKEKAIEPGSDEPLVLEPPRPMTYIFTLDSLGAAHTRVIKLLSKYLRLEAQDKLQRTDTSEAEGRQAQVPVQPNYCDCGIYLLHLAQTFMSDPDRYCRVIHMRTRTATMEERQKDWNDSGVASMREKLVEQISQLSTEWKKDRAAREEAKKSEGQGADGAIGVDSSDSDIDIVETVPTPSSRKGKAKGRVAKGPIEKVGPAARLR